MPGIPLSRPRSRPRPLVSLAATAVLTAALGAVILGRSDRPSFDWNDLSFRAIYEQVMPYAVPFAVGGIVLSLVAAIVSYPLALYFITKHRQQASARQVEPLPPADPLR